MISDFWLFIITIYAAGIVCCFATIAGTTFWNDDLDMKWWGFDTLKAQILIISFLVASWMGIILIIIILTTGDE